MVKTDSRTITPAFATIDQRVNYYFFAAKLFINLSKTGGGHSQTFFKIDFLKNFAMISGKHLGWSFFLIKLQDFRRTTLLKGDSNLGVFVEYCEVFKNSFFYRRLLVAAFKKPALPVYLFDAHSHKGPLRDPFTQKT